MHKFLISRSKIAYHIFTILIFVTAFQFSAWGITGTTYNVLRNVIIIIIIIIFLVSFKNPINHIRNIPIFRIHLIGLLIFATVSIALLSLGLSIEIRAIRDLFLALLILVISFNINLSEIKVSNLISIYILLYTVAALSIVFTFAQGFNIQKVYLPIPKNQVSPAFGVAFLLAIFSGYKHKGNMKLFYFILAGLLFASLLVIRGRAVIVAVFASLSIFFWYFIKSKKYKLLTIIIILILVPFIKDHIYDSLFLNHDFSDIDAVSAGRITSYTAGLIFFFNNPLVGQLQGASYGGDTIHNYILINLVDYGIIMSLVLLIVYFKYFSKILKDIRNTSKNEQSDSFTILGVAPLTMFLLFIISIFEYTYPYAPGSAIFFPVFLYGQFLKNQELNIQY